MAIKKLKEIQNQLAKEEYTTTFDCRHTLDSVRKLLEESRMVLNHFLDACDVDQRTKTFSDISSIVQRMDKYL